MSDQTEDLLGTQGWKQLLGPKHTILAQYQVAKIYSQGHIVGVSHGKVAEAAIRQWLSDFLPQKYGVSSGYIVSQGLNEDERLPHFDVVIYDRLNAPALWVEKDDDSSQAGAARAFSAEFVLGAIEVKSVLTPQSAKEATAKLRQLSSLAAIDEPGVRYRKFLPNNFTCCVIFIEMKDSKYQYWPTTLENLLPDEYMRGYFGGLILQGEGLDPDRTAQIELMLLNQGDSKRRTNIARNNQSILRDGTMLGERRYADNCYARIICNWGRFRFAQFAFELMQRMDGTYNPGFASTWHGFKV